MVNSSIFILYHFFINITGSRTLLIMRIILTKLFSLTGELSCSTIYNIYIRRKHFMQRVQILLTDSPIMWFIHKCSHLTTHRDVFFLRSTNIEAILPTTLASSLFHSLSSRPHVVKFTFQLFF